MAYVGAEEKIMNIDELVLVDGKLMKLFGVTPLNTVYDLPDIEITGKGDSKRATDTQFDFEFNLNSHTDPEWRDIFSKMYELRHVSFSGNSMTIRCAADQLREIYAHTKTHVQATNARYAERRDSWVDAVRKRDAENRKRDAEKKESAARMTEEDRQVAEGFTDFEI